MKRTMLLILALIMIGITTFAESIDFSSMSDSELLALKSKIDGIVESRGLNSEGNQEKSISAGIYAIGSSGLTPGGYDFTVHGEGYVWVYLGVFNTEEDAWNDSKEITSFCLTEPEQTYHLDLKDGQYLLITIPGGTCTYHAS